MDPFLAAALLALVAGLGIAVELLWGDSRLGRLPQLPADAPPGSPRVSIIVPARDEALGIRPALASLLAQQYPTLEIVAVDDRSSDATGEILDEVASREPRLRVLHVDELPDGWLGKNNALHAGAAAATGQLLVFTDADVMMDPRVVARTVNYLHTRDLDFVSIMPAMHMRGPLLASFATIFGAAFTLFVRPWRARLPGRWHVGIGAFNLVRADAYRAVGGHAPIAMSPDDDMKLAKLIKREGYRQDVLIGAGDVGVAWYGSVGELVRGFRKNSLAGVDFRGWLLLGGCVLQLLLHVGVPAAALVTSGTPQLLFAATALLLLLTYAHHARLHGQPGWHAIGYPLGALVFAYALTAATLYVYRTGGIEWRGRFHPLEELKKKAF